MLPGALLIDVINHLLEGQPWLREQFAAFAGRHALLESFPLRLALTIAEDGSLREADADAAPDAVVRLSAPTALRLLMRQPGAEQVVEITGDSALAGALHAVLRELRWDVEEDLSRIVGDVAARRIVSFGEALRAWQRGAAANLGQGIGEYLVEERTVLARRDDVQQWLAEVDRLRDDAERLRKRIERLDRSGAA